MGNMAICNALGGGTMVGDVSDCQAVAYFMATHGIPCAMFRSCAFMTRDSNDNPKALVHASPEEAMYCIANHLSKHCQVQTPFQPRPGPTIPSPNDDLTITFLFFNILENSPIPQTCDSEIFNALKDAPS
ncbi:uncharacterized protein MELLADRAFT_111189 [Melampsora larici-populina 98AG31]|uniref:Uncharacterized protein n=1 Tax=Melampsora larici-populina (strain 98AG31 / pathotype 3-4-7) TaxID=747676 RepID=F4S2B4_MELLP|nr:uncharacterized protein MELLADRAFT_111189 [Melampsora larici-populina 98AG31]EGG01146.1 hypothetical protein MELLADRAFT_111189 [Melampsora larici-populina 98AG31]